MARDRYFSRILDGDAKPLPAKGVGVIYQIICLATGKAYIGSSRNIRMRWWWHRSHLQRGDHHCLHLQHAWRKYGADLFMLDLLEQCAVGRLFQREQFYLSSAAPRELLNLSSRATCPTSTKRVRRLRSENAKRQHAQGKLGYCTWRGKHPEAGARAAATRRANGSYPAPSFEWTAERRARVAAAMRARWARGEGAGRRSTHR